MAKLLLHANYGQLQDESDIDFLWSLDQELSFQVPGAKYSQAYKGYYKDGKFVKWDGRQKLLSKDLRFPIGLTERVREAYARDQKSIQVVDCRELKYVAESSINILPRLKELGKVPYQHQLDVLEATKKFDRGIVRLGTGGGKCSAYDSLHITEEGMLDYHELLGQKKLQPQEVIDYKIQVATPLTFSRTDQASSIYRDGITESIYLTTSYGYELKATPAHKIKVISQKTGNIEWKLIGEITTEDRVIISPGTNLFGKEDKISLDDAYWYGLLIGDGCYSQKNFISFTNKEEHILKFVYNYLDNNNLKFHIYERFNHKLSRFSLAKEVRILNVKYRKYLESIGFEQKLSIEKTIPEILRRSKKEILAMVIRGIYETDGWVENVHNKPCLRLGLSSKKIIDQIHLILLNFGIVASRRSKKTTHHDSNILTIYRDYIPKFIEEIGLDPCGSKYKKLKDIMESIKDVKQNSNKDVIPYQSYKLEEIYKLLKKVFNVSAVKLQNIVKEYNINVETFRSWFGCRAQKEPSRNTLKLYLNQIQKLLIDNINLKEKYFNEFIRIEGLIESIKYICSDCFYYDKVETISKIESDNYDFVIPETHSFVSQGFINHNTLVSGLITSHFNKCTIIYVIGKDLLYQFHQFYSQVFDCPIGIIGDGKCDIQEINIASVWTMGQALGMNKKELSEEDDGEKSVDTNKYKEIRELLLRAKLHILDECHLAACRTVQTVSKYINPENIYGMSGSPWRDDGADLLIECILGKYIIDISASKLINEGFLVKPIINFKTVPPMKFKSKTHYQTIYKDYVINNPIRNELVVKGAEMLVEKGYKTLVLYNAISHGEKLYEELKNKIPCMLLSGKDDAEERDLAKKKIENGEIECILASKIFDIGVDLPCLSGLVPAGGGASSVRALQRIGRVIRKYKKGFFEKKFAAVYEFKDQAPYLLNHAQQRYKIYASEPAFDINW